MIVLNDYKLTITTPDKRCRTGNRVIATYAYPNKHDQWMKEEVLDLQAGLYPTPKYTITVEVIEPTK